jgi:hypothetical protein
VVNAGLGKGAPIGTGRYDANKATAMTNFVAAREPGRDGDLPRPAPAAFVMISSMSAMRGMPRR